MGRVAGCIFEEVVGRLVDEHSVEAVREPLLGECLLLGREGSDHAWRSSSVGTVAL